MYIPWSRFGRELKYVEEKAGCVYVNVKQKYGAWTLIIVECDIENSLGIVQMCLINNYVVDLF